MDGLCFKAVIHPMMAQPIPAVGNGEFRVNAKPLVLAGQLWSSPWNSIRSSWTGAINGYESAIASVHEAVVVEEKEKYTEREAQNGNWVSKIMLVKSLWKNGEKDDDLVEGGGVKMEADGNNGAEENYMCAVDDDDIEEKIEFNRESFSKLLQKVPWKEAKLYAEMSYLGCLAYSISQIKPGNLLKNHGLRFVTSSIEKKQWSLKAEKEKEKESAEEGKEKLKTEAEAKEIKGNEGEPSERDDIKPNGNGISAFAAYQLAASAASYLHSHTRSMLRVKSSKSMPNEDIDGSMKNIDMINQDVASLMASNSVTAVVAAEEEVKQAVADDLNSIHSSPCEWFVCDDDQSATRFFVIQGSESLASWKANLLFEPIQFEGLDVLVHRGIYEAAKGIYEQMLPEVRRHLKSHGNRAKFRFTGHSLGGSLSLLINLMLLTRGEVPRSSLLPILTFGSPSIMCGGDRLLRNLGLPRDHIRSITMHRDIVPRVFSCKYPGHVIEFLKAVNGNFSNLPCLNKQKLLYAPMGELVILQPHNKFSSGHDLLPSGSGMYILTSRESDPNEAEKQIQAAQAAFLNNPHPLEILSDRGAYGFGGTIQKDHDMSSYVKAIRRVVRQELIRIRRAKRELRRKVLWPFVATHGIIVNTLRKNPLSLSGIAQTGRDSWEWLGSLVASQQMQLILVILLPARLLIMGISRLVNFH